jgi:hypothetical protein
MTRVQLHAAIRQRWSAPRGGIVDWKGATALDTTSAHSLRCCLISSCNILSDTLDVTRIIITLNAAHRVLPNNDIWLPAALPSTCSVIVSCNDDWGAFASCMLCHGMPDSALFVIPESASVTDPATLAALAVRIGLKLLTPPCIYLTCL